MSEPQIHRGPLYPVSRSHLDLLSAEGGVWQHGTLAGPDRSFGFCTDDVSRALVVDMLHAGQIGWAAVAESVARHLKFIAEATGLPDRRLRNFRAADGTWLDAEGSEDCHARAMQGLAAVIARTPDAAVRAAAASQFERALPAAGSLSCLRPISAALLACDEAIDAGLGRDARRTFELLAERLANLFRSIPADSDWPWPERVLTYENGLPPRALIVAGRRLGDASLRRRGCSVLDWLIDAQTSPGWTFSPVGNRGWWPAGGIKSQFDQQPIEAMALLLAAETAFDATGEERYVRAAEMAYGWFLGANDLGVAVALPLTGACYDGLTPTGLNHRVGAESTLAWLTSLEHIRALRTAGSSGPTEPVREPVAAGPVGRNGGDSGRGARS